MVVFAWGVLTIPLFGIGLIFVGLTIYKYVRIKKQAALVAELSRTV